MQHFATYWYVPLAIVVEGLWFCLWASVVQRVRRREREMREAFGGELSCVSLAPTKELWLGLAFVLYHWPLVLVLMFLGGRANSPFSLWFVLFGMGVTAAVYSAGAYLVIHGLA
jgi:hypothetical protein